jgi:hypothetical protein
MYFWVALKDFLIHRELGQRLRNIGETEDKPSVIGAQAQEAPYFVFDPRYRSFPYFHQLL